MRTLKPVEIFLIQLLIYLLLWLVYDYLASLLSIILGGLCLLVLLFSLVFELVERSRVPRAYYYFLLVSVLAPLVAGLLFLSFSGLPDWLNE